jgi:hypothetical protein
MEKPEWHSIERENDVKRTQANGPVTYWYTTPSPEFRQVFALRSSEGNATCGRIEVDEVSVNGTPVLRSTKENPDFSDFVGGFWGCKSKWSTGSDTIYQGTVSSG